MDFIYRVEVKASLHGTLYFSDPQILLAFLQDAIVDHNTHNDDAIDVVATTSGLAVVIDQHVAAEGTFEIVLHGTDVNIQRVRIMDEAYGALQKSRAVN